MPTELPDEDTLRLPDEWRAAVPPRRGRHAPEAPLPDPAALAAMRAAIDAHRDALAQALDHPEHAPGIAAAGAAYLDGAPDATGAAAVARLLPSAVALDDRRAWHAREAAAWGAEHGPVFAAHAAVLYAGLAVHNGARTSWHYRTPELHEARLDWDTGTALPWNHGGSTEAAALLWGRAALAAAPEPDHRAAAARIDPHRDTPAKRIAAAFLAPDEPGWVDDACADYAGVNGYYAAGWMIYASVADPAQLAAAGLAALHAGDFRGHQTIAPLLDNLGPAALPFLTASLKANDDWDRRARIADAIALLPSDDAVRFLLDHLVEWRTTRAALAAAARFPVRTLRAVAASGRADEAQRRRLAGIARSSPHLEAALAVLEPGERAAVDAVLAEPDAVAAAGDLPRLLTAPPWAGGRPKAKAPVIAGLEPPAAIHLVWDEGEREAWANYEPRWFRAAHRERWAAETGGRNGSSADEMFFAFAPPEASRPLLADWRPAHKHADGLRLKRILAIHGPAAAAPMVEILRRNPSEAAVLRTVLSLDAARLAADWLVRLKTARLEAIAWLERHGPAAAPYLVPDALGKAKKPRGNAEAALRHLADLHGAAAVLETAAAYGPDAAEALRPVLEADPLEPLGGRVPPVGAWADPALLPRVRLRGKELVLPDSATAHLVQVLAIATPDNPYQGVDIAAEACEPASLAAFSLALFDLWYAAGAPSKDAWALTQLAHFGGDAAVDRLTPLVRAWPGENQHKRAVTGLEVLGRIGSERALRAIHGIAQRVKFKALKAAAGAQIEGIAAGLGLTGEQLADRLVPDLGLGDGPLVLDYGPRAFTVAFDEQLRPHLSDADGKPRKSLPKPNAKDDPELAEASRKRFAALKKELRTVAADQVRRLEAAMVAGRTWSAEEFADCFTGHPLMSHLARRLVWLADGTGFRVAEDGSLSDVEDDAFALADDARVRLAHPLLLGEAATTAWGTVLADYELLQPFPQLGRPVLAFGDDELRTGRLERFEGRTVPQGRILGLTGQGWERARPLDNGCEPGISFRLPAGGYLSMWLDPGITVGYTELDDAQTLRRVCFTESPVYDFRGSDKAAPPVGLDPVLASELAVALTRLTD